MRRRQETKCWCGRRRPPKGSKGVRVSGRAYAELPGTAAGCARCKVGARPDRPMEVQGRANRPQGANNHCFGTKTRGEAPMKRIAGNTATVAALILMPISACQRVTTSSPPAPPAATIPAISHPVNTVDFHQQAAAWRALATKPPLPDAVRIRRIAAEDAIKNNSPNAALKYYEEGPGTVSYLAGGPVQRRLDCRPVGGLRPKPSNTCRTIWSWRPTLRTHRPHTTRSACGNSRASEPQARSFQIT